MTVTEHWCGTAGCVAAADYRAGWVDEADVNSIYFCDEHMEIELSHKYQGMLYRTGERVWIERVSEQPEL